MSEIMYVETQHVFTVQYNHHQSGRPWLLECSCGEFSEAVDDRMISDCLRLHLDRVRKLVSVSSGDGEHDERIHPVHMDMPQLQLLDSSETGDWSARLRHAVRDTGAWDGPSRP